MITRRDHPKQPHQASLTFERPASALHPIPVYHSLVGFPSHPTRLRGTEVWYGCYCNSIGKVTAHGFLQPNWIGWEMVGWLMDGWYFKNHTLLNSEERSTHNSGVIPGSPSHYQKCLIHHLATRLVASTSDTDALLTEKRRVLPHCNWYWNSGQNVFRVCTRDQRPTGHAANKNVCNSLLLWPGAANWALCTWWGPAMMPSCRASTLCVFAVCTLPFFNRKSVGWGEVWFQWATEYMKFWLTGSGTTIKPHPTRQVTGREIRLLQKNPNHQTAS